MIPEQFARDEFAAEERRDLLAVATVTLASLEEQRNQLRSAVHSSCSTPSCHFPADDSRRSQPVVAV
ncbi:hypothetical protein ABBQ32_000208 [Trebouxia sp. C0010 RCD-2024]